MTNNESEAESSEEQHDCTESVMIHSYDILEVEGTPVRIEIGDCDRCGARVGIGWIEILVRKMGDGEARVELARETYAQIE